MALFRHSIKTAEAEYRLIASNPFLDDRGLHVRVRGSFRRLPDGRWERVEVGVRLDLVEAKVELLVDGEPIGSIPLESIADEAAQVAEDVAGAFLGEKVAEELAAELIQRIPTDPFVGCLIKSAVSTLVSKILGCWAATPHDQPITQIARAIAGCLRQFGWRIIGVFLRRLGPCMATLGFS